MTKLPRYKDKTYSWKAKAEQGYTRSLSSDAEGYDHKKNFVSTHVLLHLFPRDRPIFNSSSIMLQDYSRWWLAGRPDYANINATVWPQLNISDDDQMLS